MPATGAFWIRAEINLSSTGAEKTLTHVTAVFALASAGIAQCTAVAAIMRDHRQSANPAVNSTGQQTAFMSPCRVAVRRHLLQVHLVNAPADVGGMLVFQYVRDAPMTNPARVCGPRQTLRHRPDCSAWRKCCPCSDGSTSPRPAAPPVRTRRGSSRPSCVSLKTTRKPSAGGKRLENVPDAGLNLGVRIENRPPRQIAHIAARQRHRQLAATRLRFASRMHAPFDQMQFDLRYRPHDTEKETVVRVRNIVNPVGIRDQCVRKGAQSQQLTPVGEIA